MPRGGGTPTKNLSRLREDPEKTTSRRSTTRGAAAWAVAARAAYRIGGGS